MQILSQVATADALLEIVQRGLVSKHDTLDLILPLALALMRQPVSDEVRLRLSQRTPGDSSRCCLALPS